MKKLKLIHLSSGNNVSYLKPSGILLSVLLSFTFYLLPSQVPKGFNYQAVARDGVTGNPITDPIDLRFTIRSDSLAGTVFWVEEHYGVDPDDNGLFNVVVGRGTRISGVAKFADIDWTVTPKFLMTHINDGAWKLMGSSRLWTVPYALVADSLGGPLAKLSVKGSVSNLEDALFEVKNSSGQTVFAVYNEGVRIYVDDGSKSPKGGFAVSGFGNEKDAFSDRYLYVSRDSVRVYLDSNPDTKAPKGGFAVTGFDFAKGLQQNFLDVNGDSVRIYIDKAASTKAPKGGFAVTGFSESKAGVIEDYLRVTRDSTRVLVNEDASKGVKGGFAVSGFSYDKAYAADQYTSLTPENYLIGHRSGKGMSTGKFNSFYGYETGVENSTGQYNTILGYQSGYKNNADNNVFLGYKSGYNNASGGSNTFLGHLAGFSNSSGNFNVFLGDSSGYANDGGQQNIFLGNGSGKANISGEYNTFIGFRAGFRNQTGRNNAFIGYQAGWRTYKGSKNVFIGYEAGYNNYGIAEGPTQAGNNNIYIGDQAAYNNTTGRSNVYIGHNTGLGLTPIYGSDPPRFNVYIGYQAGYKEYRGRNNTFIGYQAGYNNNTGNYSTFIGDQAGYTHNSGNYNTFIGYQAGLLHSAGASNLFIGNEAGNSNVSGSGNVFLGFAAGWYELGTDKLFIDNQKRTNEAVSRTSSLIYGEFNAAPASQLLAINARTTLNGAFNYGAASGSADAYSVTIPGISSYVAGMMITFKANFNNTGACTINVNSLGAKSLKNNTSGTPPSGYIKNGTMVVAVYDGTNFQMIQPAAN